LRLKKNNPDFRQRVIQFELNPDKRQSIILNSLAYASSKLWNIANYEIKNWNKDKKYPDWYDQKSRLKNNFWYKNLPSQSAQETLKQLHEAWQSYHKLRKTGGIKNPKPPRYKHTNFNVRWLNKGFKIIDGKIRLSLPKQQKKYLKEKYNINVDYLYITIPSEYKNKDKYPKVIEIMPLSKTRIYKVHIITELPLITQKEDNEIYMSIDLVINNLMTTS